MLSIGTGANTGPKQWTGIGSDFGPDPLTHFYSNNNIASLPPPKWIYKFKKEKKKKDDDYVNRFVCRNLISQHFACQDFEH